MSSFLGWAQVGLCSEATPLGLRVHAQPWLPKWLETAASRGVDDIAAGEESRRCFNGQDCDGDPFLAAIGRNSYRSVGQRAAVRAALSTPPGGTLVVALPTGEGKSMVFQLVHSVGFIGEGYSSTGGVTLVIVPTVALGLNHQKEAVSICGLSEPLAYQAGAEAGNAVIAERIANGSQGLCFASPEAACGPLSTSLRKAAESGKLRALVVDEAHLVDQWGAGFRTEFQELSGLRQELLLLAPNDKKLRTLLMSATLTEQSLETLRSLFGAGGEFESISSVRLRPEPDFWVAKADESARDEHVMEALHHVPRPVVLYVTKVEHAEKWRRDLLAAGFARIGMVHGKTSREERERVVERWRDGLLDIVVGTSAFGLGIDYPHARSVIHACVPETLDRFYQEVGRGGRDGRASLSLIAPKISDFEIAKHISQEKLLTVRRGLERWNGLFNGSRSMGGNCFAVRVDGSPGTTRKQDIDMTGEWNADWNFHLLALMARAGLVRLLGTARRSVKDPGDWVEIEILDDEHTSPHTWKTRIGPHRSKQQVAVQRNHNLMVRFLSNRDCPAQLLEDLYGGTRLARTCSSCSRCRDNKEARGPADPIGEPKAPWSLPLPIQLAHLMDADHRLLVTYGDISSKADVRRLGNTLESLVRFGLAKIVLLGEPPFDQTRVLSFARSRALFISSLASLALSRLPNGPELVFVGRGQHLGNATYAHAVGRARIFVAPKEQRASSGHLLREVFGGRTLTLDEFHARVSE